MADKLSRRRFITRLMPGVAALPLAQYGYTQPLPPPGADTLEHLTARMTAGEVRDAVMLAILKEHGDLLRWVGKQLHRTGDPWGMRKRAT